MSDLKGKRVLLIGGAGFVGHNLALDLKRAGAEVSILDGLQVNNLLSFQASTQTGPRADLYRRMLQDRLQLIREANLPLLVQDARDYHAVGKAINQLQPQVVVHLAAVAHAGRANKDPTSTFGHSLRTLENALDASRGRVEHFVFFSSSMVYGNFSGDSVSEDTPCEPLGMYGAVKFASEKIVIAYNQVFGLPYTIIRPSALYGERCVSRRVGQIFIENAMKEVEIITHGDGSDRLDFTYIDDLIQGVKLVLTEEAARNEVFNLTYGESRSISDMVRIVKERFPSVEVRFKAKDELTPKRGTLNVDKARSLLGYAPAFPLETGLPKYIDWYSSMRKPAPERP